MAHFYKHIPNILTLLRIASAPFLWYAMITHSVATALLLISFAIVSDFGDGYLARRFFLSSRAGSFLDPLADKVVIIAAFIALWQQHRMPLWVVMVVAGRDVAVTALRTYLANRGVSLKTSWFAKSKTAFQFCALYIFVLGAGSQGPIFYWLSVATAFITVASSASYWYRVARLLTKKVPR
ncbi:MAG: CDP-diacylglycerol---glycerol-3-phosphate 3-phosphatidyltransferase [Candidatus Dependentiae bacterium]|nr:CDP-diacylglycerol---glycerol-3-phosphate 3-phosphatidyltransferase [Candidatus Dependentiae bacterium]